ncbi:MAG: hypothetical protein ACODAJ_04295 [Planctomycetota bacterium]
MRALVITLAVALCVSGSLLAAGRPEADLVRGAGSYAVVVSRGTYEDAEWKAVVEALRAEHDASVIVYRRSVSEARTALADVFPRHACFVARPGEAGRRFVVEVHRLTRTLDDDPYTDALWGILTGYEAEDALRIARHAEPLTVRRGLAGTGLNLDVFDAGRWFSEGKKGVMWEKAEGGEPTKKTVPQDTTRLFVEALEDFKPHLFLTSGHATTRDWQIGYSYRNGQLRCKDGQLVGVDLKKHAYPIHSPNPKVFLPAGNCLIGRIDGRDCMALALMRTGGVYQMFGYTVLTWYGYAGWGVKDLFIGQPGRYSLAEAFYANIQTLIHQLETRFPKAANVNFEAFDLETDRRLLGKLARKHGVREKDALGLLWDRDTVAFYGDPAWEARLAPRPLAWDQTLSEDDGVYTVELKAEREAKPSRPPVVLFPHRLKEVEVVEGGELQPLITDNFLLLTRPKKLEAGETYRVVFRAERVP